MSTFTISAVQNDYSSRGRGYTYYSFAALPTDSGYTSWTRIDDLPGAIVKSRAFSGTNSAARHSSTEVEVELPDGTIVKTVAKGAHRVDVVRVRGSELTDDGVKFVGNTKRPNGEWGTVIEVDGKRLTI